VVVAVGLRLVDPLADVDVKAPGVIATLVAPLAAQLSVLLVPEVMLAGFAVNEVIVGTEPFPVGEFVELTDPQPDSPRYASRMRNNPRNLTLAELSLRRFSLALEDKSVTSMRPRVGGNAHHE
jgi:hypothetical protein